MRLALRSSSFACSLLALAGAATFACGGPIPSAEGPPTSLSPDAGHATDASAPSSAPIHAMTVTLCSRDPAGCSGADRRGSDEGAALGYRVAFGTGGGTLRSRDQALADLYREIRDRTGFGTRLAAGAHHLERPARDGAVFEPGSPPRPATADGHDPVVDAAFDLMEAVDAEGRITIDVAHSATTCKLSLQPHDSDAGAGAGRCLLKGPPRQGIHEDEGVREPRKPL